MASNAHTASNGEHANCVGQTPQVRFEPLQTPLAAPVINIEIVFAAHS